MFGSLLVVPLCVYGLWQRPFAGRKFEPIEHHNDLARVRRVLDVGCGPGTNAARFEAAEYVGLDINPGYVAFARRKYRGSFEVARLVGANLLAGCGRPSVAAGTGAGFRRTWPERCG